MAPEKPIVAGKPDFLVSLCTVLDNDAAIVEQYVSDAVAALSAAYRYFEIVLVDNHSSDGTDRKVEALLAKAPNIRLIRLSRRRGMEVALSAALDHCVGDYVVTMDLRLDPISLVSAIVDSMVNGDDVVIGHYRNPRGSAAHRMFNAMTCKLAGRFLGTTLNPNTGYFLGFSRRAVNSLVRIHSKSRFIVYDSRIVGFRNAVIDYDQQWRAGASHAQESALRGGLNRVKMVIAHSLRPLRLAAALGLVAAFMNLLYLLYIFAVALLKRNIAEGWLTTSLTHTVMFLTLFLILAILAEYVGRILEESKEQPLYFVEQETSSAVSCYSKERLNVV